MLNRDQRLTLLTIARGSIEGFFEGKRPDLDPRRYDEELRRPSGAFVTLTTRPDEQLRGCIGSIQPVAPLVEAVAGSAISAAFRDPRFSPLRQHELDIIHIEVSVMSPIEVVADVEEIEVGRDGLIIRRGHAAGLLLPQVATEYGWDRDTFLQHTCLKAGLPPDAWRHPDTLIEKFSAEVFGEGE